MKQPYYDSSTGDVIDPSTEDTSVAKIEPIRVPFVIDSFCAEYIPAEDERTATDVLSLGALRERLVAYLPFSAACDPLQDYLDQLASAGFILRDTSSGPALCVIRRDSPRVITPYQEPEEVDPSPPPLNGRSSHISLPPLPPQ